MRRILAALCAAGLVGGALSACESAADKAAEHRLDKVADQSTCRADAKPAPTPYGADFPDSWPFPAKTTVFHAEDRSGTGTIVTAVSDTRFKQILGFLNREVQGAGFKVTSGETEEHDAEANWTGNGFTGRWAIRESANCPGETVIQVLAARGNG
ncbi:MAG TPA: hypothetical protein VFJ19_04020 [Nocardioidaceae bacterium]|nr:hypothetical protein [Nocardioidaceae bacterium]